MIEPEQKRKIHWGLLLTMSMLAAFVTVLMRMSREGVGPAPWGVVATGIILAGAAFLVMYWMQNGFWGVTAALLVILHPFRLDWTEATDADLWVDALGMAMFAVCVAALRLSCRRDFSWLGWLTVIAAGTAFLAAAWVRWPATARTSSLFVLVAMPLSFLGGLLFYRRGGVRRPNLGNVVCVIFAGLLIHFGALGVACLWTEYGSYLDLTLSAPNWLAGSSHWQSRGLGTESLEKWCWPTPLAVLPLAAWGLVRTAWRGWKDWKKGRPPASWLLAMYAFITVLTLLTDVDRGEMHIALELATLAALLCVFGVADLFHGLSERLILAPPDEAE